MATCGKRKRKVLSIEQKLEIVPELLHTLESIHGCGDCDEADVREWITMDSSDQGYQLLDDDEIVRAVTDVNTVGDTEEDNQDDDCDVQEVAIPSHGEVLDMLSKCLPWVEQQTETSAAHLFMYINLIEMAAAKRSSSLRQSKITSFFS